MTKADERRAALLERLADHILAKGLEAASLRALAAAAGTSDRMLLYYFKDKDEILAATLEALAARLVAGLSAAASPPAPPNAARARLADVAMSEEVWPFMALWLEIAAKAGRGDPFHREVGARLGEGFLAWIESQIDAPADRLGEEAARLFAWLEGAALLKAVGLEEVARRGI
ncbi:MAG: TetR family transcriptional regulator [Pseudomonadota bacterium]